MANTERFGTDTMCTSVGDYVQRSTSLSCSCDALAESDSRRPARDDVWTNATIACTTRECLLEFCDIVDVGMDVIKAKSFLM